MMRSLLGVFLAALTAGILAFAGGLMLAALGERAGREGGGRPAEERVLAVRTVTVGPETVAPVLEAFGELRARRELEVRAPAAGRVVALSEGFEEGGRVEAGERLVAIDPSEARAALDRARAEAAEARAELRDAERGLPLARDELEAARAQADVQARALERARSLAGRGVGTEAAIETAEIAASTAEQAVLTRRRAVAEAEARVDGARSRIERAAIELREAERGLSDTEVRAAFDGVLADVAVVEGGLVGLNERLARLVDPSRLEAVFRVSAAQYGQLTGRGGALAGLPVEVSLGVSDADLGARGVVSREGADVGEGRTGRTLFAALEEARGLRPGDFVRVSLLEPPLRGVARLPASALGADGTVLALGPDERLEVAPVTLMRRQGDDVLVRAPDLAGRAVVAERSPLLGPGIKVRPVGPEAAPGSTAEAEQDDARARASTGNVPAPGAGDEAAGRAEAGLARSGGGRGVAPAAVGAPSTPVSARAGDEGEVAPAPVTAARDGGPSDGPVAAGAPAAAGAPVASAPVVGSGARAGDDPVTAAEGPSDAGARALEGSGAPDPNGPDGDAALIEAGAPAGIRDRAATGAPAHPAAAAVALADERRAALRAAVEADAAMSPEERSRLLADLDRAEVPVATVERIEPGKGL